MRAFILTQPWSWQSGVANQKCTLEVNHNIEMGCQMYMFELQMEVIEQEPFSDLVVAPSEKVNSICLRLSQAR